MFLTAKKKKQDTQHITLHRGQGGDGGGQGGGNR